MIIFKASLWWLDPRRCCFRCCADKFAVWKNHRLILLIGWSEFQLFMDFLGEHPQLLGILTPGFDISIFLRHGQVTWDSWLVVIHTMGILMLDILIISNRLMKYIYTYTYVCIYHVSIYYNPFPPILTPPQIIDTSGSFYG